MQQPSKACKMQAFRGCGTGKHVVATVWSHTFAMARRLGIVYCMNRPCSLYCASVLSAEVRPWLLARAGGMLCRCCENRGSCARGALLRSGPRWRWLLPAGVAAPEHALQQLPCLHTPADRIRPAGAQGTILLPLLKGLAASGCLCKQRLDPQCLASCMAQYQDLLMLRSAQDDGGAAEELVAGATSLHSARFCPGGQELVCLSHQAAVDSGCHSASAQLLKLPWPVSGTCMRGSLCLLAGSPATPS